LLPQGPLCEEWKKWSHKCDHEAIFCSTLIARGNARSVKCAMSFCPLVNFGSCRHSLNVYLCKLTHHRWSMLVGLGRVCCLIRVIRVFLGGTIPGCVACGKWVESVPREIFLPCAKRCTLYSARCIDGLRRGLHPILFVVDEGQQGDVLWVGSDDGEGSLDLE
jgi:hypothetical protein